MKFVYPCLTLNLLLGANSAFAFNGGEGAPKTKAPVHLADRKEFLTNYGSPRALAEEKLSNYGFVVERVLKQASHMEELPMESLCVPVSGEQTGQTKTVNVTKLKFVARSAWDYYEVLGTWECDADVIESTRFKNHILCRSNSYYTQDYLLPGSNRSVDHQLCGSH